MKSASVTELKANLSRYLRMVRRGSEVEVLERGVPIARLVGLAGAGPVSDRERVKRLAVSGVLRPGTGDVRRLLADAPIRAKRAALARALDEDRDDRL